MGVGGGKGGELMIFISFVVSRTLISLSFSLSLTYSLSLSLPPPLLPSLPPSLSPLSTHVGGDDDYVYGCFKNKRSKMHVRLGHELN